MKFSNETPLLTVLVEIDPPTLLVRLQGEIDLSCVELLDSIHSLNLEDVVTMTLDLADLEFVDSAGTEALLRLRATELASGRDVRLIGPRPNVRKVFHLLGQEHVLAA
jgi:anti-anti-sigma factor